MALEQIDENMWLQRRELGSYDVCSVLLRDATKAMVWDSMVHPRDMADFLPLIEGRELTLVYSHADWDHIWGTAGLPVKHTQRVAHAACARRFVTDVPERFAQQQAVEPETMRDVQLLAPTITFQTEFSLQLADCTVQMKHLPGHTEDSIIAFIEEKGVLLMGDCAELPLVCVDSPQFIETWIEGLTFFADHPQVKTIIPSHGPVCGKEILHENIAYLNALLGRGRFTYDEGNGFYRTTHEQNLLALRKVTI